MKRKTVGQEALERQLKDDGQDAWDTQKEVNKEFWDQVQICIKNHADWETPYYILVHLKKEQLMHNVIRRYFIARQTLPTPQWDQTVFRFDPKSGECQYVWTLPDEDTAKWMYTQRHEVEWEENELLNYVIKMVDGHLFDSYMDKYHRDETSAQREHANKPKACQLIL